MNLPRIPKPSTYSYDKNFWSKSYNKKFRPEIFKFRSCPTFPTRILTRWNLLCFLLFTPNCCRGRFLVFLNFWGRNFVRRRKQHRNFTIILIGNLIEFWASHEILCCMKDFQIMRSQVCNAYEYANSPEKIQHKCYKMHLEIQKCNLFGDFNLGR